MKRRLSSLDNLFLQLETPTTPMHVGALMLFSEDQEGVDARFDRLRRTPVRSEPFNLRLRPARLPGQRPSWEAVDAVPIDEHVSRETVPAGATDEQLMAFISQRHSPRLDRSRPMWECRMLDGLGPGRFALYYRVHHALIDGVSGVQRMQDGLSDDPMGDTAPLWAYEPPPRRRRPPLGAIAKARKTLAALRTNARVIAELGDCMRQLAQRIGVADRSAVPYTLPNTRLNNMLCARRKVAWQGLPLAEVRAIGKAAGATVNEVALTICGAVLREELLRHSALPDKPLAAMVPVSLRAVSGDGAAGNAVSSIVCNLATHVADPAERLRLVTASSRDAKQLLRQMSPQAAEALSLVVGFPAIGATLLGRYARFRLPFNVVVSNVPGPRAPLYDRGARLDAIYPVSLLWEREALNITLISYRDTLDVGLVACAEALPDLQRTARDMRDAFEQLHHAVLG